MKKLLFVLAATISLTACKQNTKKSSGSLDKDVKDLVKKAPGLNAGTGTFTIAAIEGWTKTDTSLAGLQATLLKSALEGDGDVFMENINVVTEKAAGYDLDKYFEANVSTLSTQMPGYSKISSGNQIINGQECRRLAYSHSYTGTETYFFVKDGIGYIITCSTEKGKLEKWKPSFDKVVNTFTIN
jgi:hypothetical protein